MKILIINYEFPPLGGGAGRGSYNLARELVRAGHTVDVLTSRSAGYAKRERVEGFHVNRVRSLRKGIHDCGFRGALTFLIFAVPQFLRMTQKNNYQIIHYYFSLPTGLLRFLPGKHRKVPYVVSLRGSDVPNYDTFNGVLQAVHKLLMPVTRKIWLEAGRVVALSSDLRNSAYESYMGAQIDIVPNGIESDIFVPQAGRAKAKNAAATTTREFKATELDPAARDAVPSLASVAQFSDEKKINLVCVARLIERKGVQHLLHALKQLDNRYFLTVVGEGNFMPELLALAAKLEVEDKVNFYGYCPREQLVGIYNQSDIFVLPSMAESFGMVFVEAMSCGLPVIGARIGGVPDIIREENGLLVEPDSIESVRDAIETLALDPERRQRMSLANRERAVDDYAWASVAEAYQSIYRRITREQETLKQIA